MFHPESREPFVRRLLSYLGLFAIAWSYGCAAKNQEYFIPPPVAATASAISSSTATETPEPTSTPEPSPSPIILRRTPTPTRIPTITPGLPWVYGDISDPTITAEAIKVAATEDAQNQLDRARRELPEWYLQNVYSLVFRGGGPALGYTGIKLNAETFIGRSQVLRGYAYFLVDKHTRDALAQHTQLTVNLINDFDSKKNVYPHSLVIPKSGWKFAAGVNNLAILAVKTDQLAGGGVTPDQFANLDEWNPNDSVVNRTRFKGLCAPYADNIHPFWPWLFDQVELDIIPVINYENTYMLAFINPTAKAASGCPVLNEYNQIVAVSEAFFAHGFLANAVNRESITALAGQISIHQ